MIKTNILQLEVILSVSWFCTAFLKTDLFKKIKSRGVILEAVLCRARSWTSMTFGGPLQLRIFYDCIFD